VSGNDCLFFALAPNTQSALEMEIMIHSVILDEFEVWSLESCSLNAQVNVHGNSQRDT